MTVDRAAAVAGGCALGVPALHNALISVALADAGNVDLIAGCKHIGLQHVANVQFVRVVKVKFLQVLYHAHAGLFQVALLGLGQFLLGNFFEAELDGLVAFLFLGHLLHDHARAGLDDGDRDDLARLVEDLRHADLLADYGFLHIFSSFGYWLPRIGHAQRLAT